MTTDSKRYPRTYHLPWSPGKGKDDKVLKDVSSFLNVPLIITEKCDGSNVCLENEACFARSHSGPPDHPSFAAFKSLHASIKHQIPPEIQIFGEWLYAKHSIHYTSLPSYFLMFAIRSVKHNMWLSWSQVKDWAKRLGLKTVPELAQVIVSNEQDLKKLVLNISQQPSCFGSEREGVVVRYVDGFLDSEFSTRVIKIVRANHVTTSNHWKHQEIIKNGLKEK